MKKLFFLFLFFAFVFFVKGQTTVLEVGHPVYGKDFGQKGFYDVLSNNDKELLFSGLKTYGIDTLNCKIVDCSEFIGKKNTYWVRLRKVDDTTMPTLVKGVKTQKDGVKPSLCIQTFKDEHEITFHIRYMIE